MDVRRKWTSAVNWKQRSDWEGPTSTSVLCSKHFEASCFDTEGSRYIDQMGLTAAKRLKPDAIHTIFPRSTDRFEWKYKQGTKTSF